MEPTYEIIDDKVVKVETETVIRQTTLSVEELEARIADADNQIAKIQEYKAANEAELAKVIELLNN